MSIKPILFNTEMVRAIMDGRKTVTRRLPSNRIEDKWMNYEEWVNAVAPPGSTSLTEKEFYEQYPPYKPGDIMYVRETWCAYYMPDGSIIHEYRASEPNANRRPTGPEYDDSWETRKWHPSIHMPKEAARIFLKVTNVRVERLQEIDDTGVIAEGLQIGDQFDELWNSTIKKSDLDRYGWNANPWVWVIEFERCEKPGGLEE